MGKSTTTPACMSTLAAALLDLGKLIVSSGGHNVFRPMTQKSPPITDDSDLMEVIKESKDTRKLIMIRNDQPEPVETRVVAVVLYLSLLVDYHPTVRLVSELVGRESPSDIMHARLTIRRLCERQVLRFQNGVEKPWNGILVLTPKTVVMLGLNGANTPVFSEKTLRNQAPLVDGNGDVAVAKDAAPKGWIPTAEVLHDRIRERVKGAYLEQPIRQISAMYVMHLHRANMIRQGRHPGTPNVVGLMIGSSSAGKTFLAEATAKVINEVCGEGVVPFSSFSATDLTAEGYVGCSVEDIVRPLLDQCKWDATKARWGCAFTDEIDKRASHADHNSLDVSGRAVQENLLRIIGGSIFPVGSRRAASLDQRSAQFNSDGTMFLFGGAFVGLCDLLKETRGASLGFGGEETIKDRPRLRDCLVEYGLIPEFVSRLGSIIVFPDPSLTDLQEVLVSPGGLLTCYSTLWLGMDMEVTVAEEGIRIMAGYGVETRSFARGIQSILNRVTEQLVFAGTKGKVVLGETEISAVLSSMGDCG